MVQTAMLWRLLVLGAVALRVQEAPPASVMFLLKMGKYTNDYAD